MAAVLILSFFRRCFIQIVTLIEFPVPESVIKDVNPVPITSLAAVLVIRWSLEIKLQNSVWQNVIIVVLHNVQIEVPIQLPSSFSMFTYTSTSQTGPKSIY